MPSLSVCPLTSLFLRLWMWDLKSESTGDRTRSSRGLVLFFIRRPLTQQTCSTCMLIHFHICCRKLPLIEVILCFTVAVLAGLIDYAYSLIILHMAATAVTYSRFSVQAEAYCMLQLEGSADLPKLGWLLPTPHRVVGLEDDCCSLLRLSVDLRVLWAAVHLGLTSDRVFPAWKCDSGAH